MFGGCGSSEGSSGTKGVDCVLEDVSNTMLFLLPSVCVAAVCAVGILVGLVAWIVLEDVLKTMRFSVPLCVCGGCGCSGVSS